jgi:hypothetical protein
MRAYACPLLLTLAALISWLGVPGAAQANPYDISLRGVGRPLSESLDDRAVKRYRFLSNELTMAMAPRPLAPAETLGMDGFEIAVSSTLTSLSWGSRYWQGQPGNPVFEGVAHGGGVPKLFWTPSVHLRKGLPLSMEIGLQGTYLAYSEMFNLGVEYKIAWHEAFFRWLPALSTRIAFSRLFGNSDISVITGEADLLTSLPIGLGGMAQVTPYLGYGQLFAHIDSMVLDETPENVWDTQNDQKGGSRGGTNSGSLYRFPTISWEKNAHGRLIIGTRLIVAFIEVLFEFNWLFMDGPNPLQSYSIKLGFDV